MHDKEKDKKGGETTHPGNGRAILPRREHGIHGDEMQFLRVAVRLLLLLGPVRCLAIHAHAASSILVGSRAIDDLVPGILDALREAVEVGLRPARALAHHAQDAVWARRVVRRGFAREEVCRCAAAGAGLQVLEHDIHEGAWHDECRAVQRRDRLGERELLRG